MGSNCLSACQCDQMLTKQRVQRQKRSLDIGAEEILIPDSFQICTGVDADGALILSKIAGRIIALEEAELTAETDDRDLVHFAHKLTVVTLK